jgi:hypothetical protein
MDDTVAQVDLDSLERNAVVDDATAGLGHAIRGDDVVGEVGRGTGASEDDGAEKRGIDACQSGGDEGDEGRTGTHRVGAGLGCEAGNGDERGPGHECPGDHRESPDMGGRKAGEPRVAVAHPEARARCQGAGPHGIPREDRDARLPGGSARGHEDGIALLDGSTADGRVARLVGDHRGSGRLEEATTRSIGEPGVEGKHRVALVPRPTQSLDEGRSARHVETDEFSHRREA